MPIPYTFNMKSIDIDNTRDELLTPQGKTVLNDGYLMQGESFQEAFARAACSFADDSAHAQRIYDYASKHWFMFATPVLANAGNPRGLPISCFLQYVEDSCEGLIDTIAEASWLSVRGGGIAAYYGDIRSIGQVTSHGNETPGMVSFIKGYDTTIGTFKQGKCYEEGTEVLTSTGFKDFRNLTKQDLVAQVNKGRQVSFVNPLDIIVEDYEGELVQIQSEGTHLSITPNHSMVVERLSGERYVPKHWKGYLEKIQASDVKYHRDVRHHVAGSLLNEFKPLSSWDRLRIAFQADGHIGYTNKDEITHYTFHFSKERKINRLTEILNALDLEYKINLNKDGTTVFYIQLPSGTLKKDFEWIDLSQVDFNWCTEFLRELSLWDGTLRSNSDSFSYTSIEKSVIDKVMAITSLCNCRVSLSTIEAYDNRQEKYSLFIRFKYTGVSGDTITKFTKPYKGKVYCCLVPEGMIIVRYKDKISVCGNTRRGAGAVYVEVNHPEIVEFINFRRDDRTPDHNRMMSYIHHGINITDAFMEAVTKGGEWPLIDPHSKKETGRVDARMLWKEIIACRLTSGEPYLHFVDTANKYLPDALKIRGLKIHGSNLCSEIELPTDKDRTAVCCLSSVNLEKYEEWKDEPLFIEDLIRMLDNVIEDFIIRAPTALHKAVKSAMHERSLGLGSMGWHYFLQSKSIPWESVIAIQWLKRIHGQIFHEARAATFKLGKEKGEALDMVGTGQRNAHLIAIAPNAKSGDICGETSPSIEPLMMNCFLKGGKEGDNFVKNRYLSKRLQELGKDTFEVWQSINTNEGSVQHLTFLTKDDKDVFKTAIEIDQNWVIEHAAVRQQFIDQGQSVNLFFAPDADFKDLHKVHKSAWEKGMKALYYLRSKSAAKVDAIGTGTFKEQQQQSIEFEKPESECLSCSG